MIRIRHRRSTSTGSIWRRRPEKRRSTMVDEIHHPDGGLEHSSVRHERTDANFRAILIILIGAMVFAAVVHFVIWVFFKGYAGYQARIKQSPFPLAPAPSTALPPEPRLEQLDRVAEVERPNVYERQAVREDRLNRYGTTQ